MTKVELNERLVSILDEPDLQSSEDKLQGWISGCQSLFAGYIAVAHLYDVSEIPETL